MASMVIEVTAWGTVKVPLEVKLMLGSAPPRAEGGAGGVA